MTVPGHEIEVARGLVDFGILTFLEKDEMIWIGDQPLVNGWFGVGKRSYLDSGSGDTQVHNELDRFEHCLRSGSR